jgi:hypothetical protein
LLHHVAGNLPPDSRSESVANIGCTNGREFKVKLKDIVLDAASQARVSMDSAALADYVVMLDDSEQPRCDLFGVDRKPPYYIGEGHHRIHTLAGAGREEVKAILHNGGPFEALCYNLLKNKDNPIRFTNADKRHAILKILETAQGCDLTDRQIHNLTGLSHSFIWKVRHGAPPPPEIALPDDPEERKQKKKKRTYVQRKKVILPPTHRIKRSDADETDDGEIDSVTAFRDATGNPVPHALQDVFGDKLIGDAHDMLLQIRTSFSSVARWNPWLRVEEAANLAENLISLVEAALPFAVHAKCGGAGCPSCRTVGFVPKWRHAEIQREEE